ncbi:MAG: redoxin domain-containing protein [Bacteroidetes bacterium]|nr:redoxin domain-containing protein [Bacteroidota bacterium]
MKKFFTVLLIFMALGRTNAQTPLTIAPDFSVKTVEGAVIQLYPLLDAGKVVALDFFSVSCGPCQLYAPHFQGAFEAFGRNLGDVFFLGINYNGTNSDVIFFDSVFNLTFPSASGLDGGGNAAFHLFQLAAYPTVLVIRPDKVITNPYIWPPTTDNIIDAVLLAGGTLVGLENKNELSDLGVFPNPVSGQASIRFKLDTPQSVAVDLLDLSGRHIRQLLPQTSFAAGAHEINFSASGLPDGTFFVAFSTDEERYVRKLHVLKR